MQTKSVWVVVIVVIIMLVLGVLIVPRYLHQGDKVSDIPALINEEVKDQNTAAFKNVYTDPNRTFSFSYPDEFGTYIESRQPNLSLSFKGTHDDFSGSAFSVSLSTRDQVSEDYTASQSIESTGDYNPYISASGWDVEKNLVQNSKDGFIPCPTEAQGVYRAVLCQIKTIGKNTFLIKYSRDSYKGDMTVKQYITYSQQVRYEFGGGKGLVFTSYFPNTPESNQEVEGYILGTEENLRNHKPSKEEVLVEETLVTLTF